MAKNKQKNGQTFGPKMAKALKIRCDELEDCVVSQQKVIAELESKITNDSLGYQLKEKRYNDAMAFLELNRPEILQLMKAHAKHGALAAAGKVPTVTVKLVKRKLKTPKIPESQLPLYQAGDPPGKYRLDPKDAVKLLPQITLPPLDVPDITPPMPLSPACVIAPEHIASLTPSGPPGVEVYDFKKKKWDGNK